MNKTKQLKEEVNKILNEKPILMDSFDTSYLKDFHHILRENFDITDINHPKLSEIKKHIGNISLNSTKELRDVLLNMLNENEFQPYKMSKSDKLKFKIPQVSEFEELEDVTASEDVEKAKKFLEGYSRLQGGGRDITLENFEINWGGRNPEQRDKLNQTLSQLKSLNPEMKMLTLGPRWPAEITFIRNKFGINAIGLDLFSIDETKVVIGDMHDMPFEDNSFDVVYEKNTYNKSYDIRKALDESLRVLKPGGVLIYDECMDYKVGVNENGRTNIKSHKWTESYLKDRIETVIYSSEPSAAQKDLWWMGKAGIWIAKIRE